MDEPDLFFRYRRQIRMEEFGKEAQEKLLNSTVILVGCGGLGTVISNTLVRAGVGKIVIVDPDIVELDNLQRQVLFDEEDVLRKSPKAQAAAEKLRNVNSQVSIEPLVEKLSPQNIESIFDKADLVFDGSDDMKTRFLINDACVKLNVPWIYGGVVATYGTSFTIIPSETPCLRCFIEDLPSPGDIPKCQEVGVLGPAVSMIASIEVTEGLKLLMGKKETLLGKIINVDVWSGNWQLFEIEKRSNCPACGQHRFEFLG
jgi:molybdopterin/thiamine biosynthesis adenylyltransferase